MASALAGEIVALFEHLFLLKLVSPIAFEQLFFSELLFVFQLKRNMVASVFDELHCS